MNDETLLSLSKQSQNLLRKGVVIPAPSSVEIGPSVNPDWISAGVVIHSGCKIFGGETSIGPDCVIGGESPATIDNCQLGRGVKLKGGYFSGAVFLDDANMGSGAHVRPGTLLEEKANGAHSVGFKQTILLPFVTIGSLINFCDCLMAGGTSRKNHSEVGSSYIHFNFTPRGDKATASLIGDVPRGVMLDQPPIFLGGQGGIVGPARIEYGCVTPAGIVHRGNALEKGQLLLPKPKPSLGPKAFVMEAYGDISRVLINNLIYIGNIRALQAWYTFVRQKTMNSDAFTKAVYKGALQAIEIVLSERIKRLAEVAAKMVHSIEWYRRQTITDDTARLVRQQQSFIDGWPEMEAALRQGPDDETGASDRDGFLAEWDRVGHETEYLKAVKLLTSEARQKGTAWLQAIVDSVAAHSTKVRDLSE